MTRRDAPSQEKDSKGTKPKRQNRTEDASSSSFTSIMASTTSSQETATGEGWNVKFVPFSSAVDSPFWVRYCQEKLETIKLKEDPIPIRATFGVSHGSGSSSSVGGGADAAAASRAPRLQCQETSLLLDSNDKDGNAAASNNVPNERIAVNGTLIGFNTKESFQKTDKNALIHDAFCPIFFAANNDEKVVQSLNSVLLLTFPDLKAHKVLYWFAFPALMTRSGKSIRAVQQQLIGKAFSFSDCTALRRQIAKMRLTQALSTSAAAASSSSAGGGLPAYFIWSKTKASCVPLSKKNYKELVGEEEGNDESSSGGGSSCVVFGLFDPVGGSGTIGKDGQLQPETPTGWSLRNLVAYLSCHLNLGGKTVQILSYRPGRLRRISSEKYSSTTAEEQQIAMAAAEDDSHSILLDIIVPTKHDYKWDEVVTTSGHKTKYRVVGWELNARSKSGPRSVNLRPILDTKHLAIQAADLNLKLMKWRQIPDLNVDLLQSTKALIIGAGTLGCNVARILLGWGVRSFKIVDYGKVSYSNPVRQPLFTLEDCQADNGNGRSKSVAAAEALRDIAADVESEGLILSIPMPGHAESREAIAASVEELDKLVQECDVVFLLTDTRESRWLPTIMAAAHDKMLINAALGLDSWLVMRHGGGGSGAAKACEAKPRAAQATAPLEPEGTSASGMPKKKAPEPKQTPQPQRLGCYYCNDIVAPENSTKNRTLDQQCTVTRPGLAPIASSMAVEMMVALLHHPDGARAPAPAAMANFSPTISSEQDATSSPLGVIPHQVRGSLVSYTMMKPTVPAFNCCTGCSASVVQAYLQDKVEVVFQTCQSVEYLDSISGLTAFRSEAAEKLNDFDDWDDDDCGELE